MLFAQILMGIYLKLHLEKGINGKIRRFVKMGHGILGKALPVLAWTQMLFGGITALGFCQGEHVGQCLAHFIMGSAFIAYGILLTLLLLVGQLWLRRTGRSQEFFDSAIIAAWGMVNTFTEHRWGTAWVKNDWQHTAMGIIWWAAGLAGVWLSKDRDGRPQRNFIPGFVILITGWAMSAHPQELMISAETHKMFGYTLMAAGATRMIEVSFVLRDRPGVSENGRETSSFQFVPAFVSSRPKYSNWASLIRAKAALRFRLLIHGRYRRANVIGCCLWHGSRCLYLDLILARFLTLPLCQCAHRCVRPQHSL